MRISVFRTKSPYPPGKFNVKSNQRKGGGFRFLADSLTFEPVLIAFSAFGTKAGSDPIESPEP